MNVSRSITIAQPRAQIYDVLRRAWSALTPGGEDVEWQAVIVRDDANDCVAWRSIEGSEVRHEGRVEFKDAPPGRGTEVVVQLDVDPPGGAIGAGLARLFGEDPGEELKSALRRLKQLLELGEVVRSDGSLAGAGQGVTKQRAAQPPDPRAAQASNPGVRS